jgi:hypothetical protein
MTKVSEEYLAKAKKLNKEEAERLLSRMTGKLPRRLEKDKLTKEEAMALQLELEDEQLQEWRKVMAEVKGKEEAKKKAKAPEQTKSSKSKSSAKASASGKAKVASKPKAVKNTKAPAKTKVAEGKPTEK